MDPRDALKNFKPSKDFFVGIDSDGCVFPTMELKHKECFIPNFIRFYGLQGVSRAARETWEFVNLYSLDRGANRFPALVKSVELLIQRGEFLDSGIASPDMKDIRGFTASTKPQSNAGLKEYLKENDTPSLRNLLAWSEAVNADIDRMVKNVRPFPSALRSIALFSGRADLMVVSGTPTSALEKEWKEHGIDRSVRLICGQEMGSKKEHLGLAAKGKYPDGRILMIGDAPGDHKAALSDGALFFPVNPGAEELSWRTFHDESIPRFLDGSYTEAYEGSLTKTFYDLLPASPSWR